ncbi:unnamed protein product [Mytilus coruscus]|uniref:Uncharacterized protein n=1 Tax=Mytilus coruscus TaxID=42192 RepID=A0A6J8A6W8_MYTCO|nr:unnamed protein product [Mytilus coruscus]
MSATRSVYYWTSVNQQQHVRDKSKKLYVRYDTSEKHTKSVAGQHPSYYEFECKSGYIAKASASELKISSSKPLYTHKEVTEKQGKGITLELYKDNQPLTTAVDIGDILFFKMNGSGLLCLSTNGGANRRRRSSNLKTNHLDEHKEETSSVSFTVIDRFDERKADKGIQNFPYIVYNFWRQFSFTVI